MISCQQLEHLKREPFPTFLTEDQSVIVSSMDKGEMVPSTTAFIFASTSARSEWQMRMTKSEVVLSETPKRLRASVIYPWDRQRCFHYTQMALRTLFDGFNAHSISEWTVLVLSAN